MLKFYSYLPDLTRDFPIQKASVKNWDWYQRMLDHLRHMQRVSGKDGGLHVSKCPGIIDICNKGWVHYTYQDIEITTNGDGASFQWQSRVDQKSQGVMGSIIGDYISYHVPSDFMMFAQFRRNTLQTIIKIVSPWFVVIPDGYCLMSLPIPYTQNLMFSAAPGILRGTQALNVQLFWHELDGTHVIPAGTPLCQYILLPDVNEDYEILDGTEETWNTVNRPLLDHLLSKYQRPNYHDLPGTDNQLHEEAKHENRHP